MARLIPSQIKKWTQGKLVQTKENELDHSRFYRGISTDTRSIRKDEVFVCLKGERFDGHTFIPQALEKGAGLIVADQGQPAVEELQQAILQGHTSVDLLIVQDTLEAYQQIASGYRQTLLSWLIAITGSVGKTTTRRMVSTVIANQLHVHETIQNQNNLVGVPLTVLKADDEDEVIIAELGMDRCGEIRQLSQLTKPDIAIVTNIGYSHAEYLGSRENILKEKMAITDGMKPNGILLLNGEDDYLMGWGEKYTGSISIWTVQLKEPSPEQLASKKPLFWAESISATPHETLFTARCSLDPNFKEVVQLPVPGKFLVRAALFALASAYALGLNMRKAAESCLAFQNTGSRQLIMPVGPWTVIDDSYNASPESILSALETLDLITPEGGRKLVALGGVRELGPYTEELHRLIGQRMARTSVDELFLAGPETCYVEESLKALNPSIPVHRFNTTEELIPAFLNSLRAGDSVLLKGSRYYQMETILHSMQHRLEESNR